ncbi:tyrosine-type recombinase/integrase [Amycolatopsis sacchari]|uniref:tyrosine-type recombinase/integrase n=1 Tax=Amycolatopsis sacchari TaxID=115433 RepID=UPI003D7429A9
MEIGTYGKIRYVTLANGSVRAKARFRGFDGVVRDIGRTGATATKAERALKSAINQELRTPSGGDITARSRFREVAKLWLAWQERRVESGERASGTLDNYRSMLNNHVLPAFGELRLSEVTVPRLDRFFPALQAKSSAAHARTARSVVGGILRYAARHGAITTNPIRDIEPIAGGTMRKARALTPDERREWLSQLELDPKAVAKDLPDLTRFMLATGVRIGEALALYWEDVDLDAARVSIKYTVVRVRGAGLRRKKPKTDAGVRTLPLPSWAVEMLRRRYAMAKAENRSGASPVFPDSLGGLRDPSNTRRALREARGSDGFAWVTSHVFRKTAGTVMDEAKLSARQIADHLGHAKPSMTQDVYMGRGTVSAENAAALEDLL